MLKNPVQSPRSIDTTQANSLVKRAGEWILIIQDNQAKACLARADLQLYLQQLPETEAIVKTDKTTPDCIDLMAIPALRHDLTEISIQASLHEALEMLNQKNRDALCVLNHSNAPIGLLLRSAITHHFMHTKSA